MIKFQKKQKKKKMIATRLFRRMGLGCLFAAIISALVFLASYQLMTGYMRKKAQAPRTVELQKKQIAYEMQAFIAKHNLSTGDINEIRLWQLERGVRFEFLGTEETVAQKEALMEQYRGSVMAAFGEYAGQDETMLFEMRFRDRTVLCRLILQQDTSYEKVCLYSSLILALFLYGMICILVMRSRLTYVLLLRDEISNMSGEGLTEPITVKGRDELSDIGREMNLVRQEVISRIQDERQVISANQELITAMSHDLRTPLTRQIGYLEILHRKKYQTQQELEEYIEKARTNAFIMKDTTDKLFRYFLAFGKPESKEQQMEAEGKPLFNSVLKEQVSYIVSQGFVVSFEEVTQSFKLKIAADDFARVFDNIFHNLKKYGDVSVPVYISWVLQEGEFLLMVQNGIKKDISNVESTKVGLKIVERIMKSMDGSLEVMNDGQYFIIQLVFKVLT